MRNIIFSAFVLFLTVRCSDDGDRLACEKATQELADATEAVRIFRQHAPPSVCNPCTVQQTYQIELAKLVKLETEKKVAKSKACNY